MMTLFTTLEATWITVITIVVLLVVFLIHYYFIESKKDNIKPLFVVIMYSLLFFMLVASMYIILSVWGYDITTYLGDLFNQATFTLETSIPRIVGTLLTIFVGLIVLKIAKISLYRLTKSTEIEHRRKKTIAKVTLSIIKYTIVIISLLVILALWGINVAPALAGLGILGLVVGLGAQQFINDLISGFFIIFEHHFDVGDYVEIDGFMGEVTDIGLKTTQVKNFKGEVKIFNNGKIDPVSNFSKTESLAIVDFGIAYKEDIKKAIDVLNEHLPRLLEEQENMVEVPRILGVTNLSSSSVDIRVVCKTKSVTHWGVERAMRQRIKEILDANGIEIPFPQVVVHQPRSKTKGE
jgi:small conductance mechanosensitive channel